jgi:uncharacterized phage-associated protein/transcriptional regulator with XRE-family HTH domain
MKSPFTGGEVFLRYEKRRSVFRKEEYEYTYVCYECADTKEKFTTTQQDNVNTLQVYNQYRVRYGIPFADEIKSVRTLYGLSAKKMSQILGFGENMYRLYENGEIPNVANGKTLKAIQTPDVFSQFVEDSRNEISDKDYERIKDKIKDAKAAMSDSFIKNIIFGGTIRGEYNGYAVPSMSRLKNTILYFIGKFDTVFMTQMNKLLFYADFVSYREYGRSITGLSYKAIQHGPVPKDWNKIYSMTEDLSLEEMDYGNGIVGYKLVSDVNYDEESLTDEQKGILDKVYRAFASDNATRISEKSHEEDAWKDNEKNHSMISYNYAFSIKAL